MTGKNFGPPFKVLSVFMVISLRLSLSRMWSLEKLYVFSRNLNRKLPKKKDPLPYEIQDAIDLRIFSNPGNFYPSIK
jgi:hypothetical protein